jgi:hypothetical protein
LEQAKTTAFDSHGLRVIESPLPRYEYCFPEVSPEIEEWVSHWEYTREVQKFYEQFISFSKLDHAINNETPPDVINLILKRSLAFISGHPWQPYFPLSYAEIREHLGQFNETGLWSEVSINLESDIQGMIKTVPADRRAFREIKGPELDHAAQGSLHCVQVDWSRGSKAIRIDFESWLKNHEKASLKRRPERKLAENRLDQLAAWRARRAGLNHGEYTMLKPRTSYADASAFNKAAKAAEKEIHRRKLL